ncbi:MAG: hypothetical protein WKF77_24570, partial [Planctomycetaceae bacterium]
MLLSATAVNLVQNGSFEVDPVSTGSFSDNIVPAGWSGAIEIQDNIPGIGGAAAGAQHVELDSTDSTSVQQYISGLYKDSTYTLSYMTRQRPGTLAKENWIRAEVFGNSISTPIESQDFNAGSDSIWTSWSLPFQSPSTPFGSSTTYVTVKFTDSSPSHGGTSDSLGSFLDDVQLKWKEPVLTWDSGSSWSIPEGSWSQHQLGFDLIKLGQNLTGSQYSIDLSGVESAGFRLQKDAFQPPEAGAYVLEYAGTLDYETDPWKIFNVDLKCDGVLVTSKQLTVRVDNVGTLTTIVKPPGVARLANSMWRVPYDFNQPLADSVFEVQVEKLTSPTTWSNVPGYPVPSAGGFKDIGPFAGGEYRVRVKGTWTKANSNGNDISFSNWETFIENAPPVAQDFPYSHNYTSCAGYGAAFYIPLANWISDIETLDGALVVSWESTEASTVPSLAPVPGGTPLPFVTATSGSGLAPDGVTQAPYVTVNPDDSLQKGTFKITYKIKDAGLLTDTGVITVTITNSVPNPTTTITAPAGDSVYLVDAATPEKVVDIQWTGTDVQQYQWESYGFAENGDGALTKDDWHLLNSGSVASNVTSIDDVDQNIDANGDGSPVDKWGPGIYWFRVKSTNCIQEDSGWKDVVFVVASVEFVSLNNSEDQCMVCHVLPGEQPAPGTTATAGDGGLTQEIPGPATGSALTPFATVQSGSATNPHPVTYAKLTIAKGINTGVDLWESGSPLLQTTVTVPNTLAGTAGSGLVSPLSPVQW